jgi:hypothetical protein
MKVTINNENPLVTVSPEPFSGKAFDGYVWHRVVVKLPIQPDVIEARGSTGQSIFQPAEEVTENPDEKGHAHD